MKTKIIKVRRRDKDLERILKKTPGQFQAQNSNTFRPRNSSIQQPQQQRDFLEPFDFAGKVMDEAGVNMPQLQTDFVELGSAGDIINSVLNERRFRK